MEPDTALRIYIIRPAMALNYRAGKEPLAKNFTITIGLLLVKNVYSRLPIYDTIIKTLLTVFALAVMEYAVGVS